MENNLQEYRKEFLLKMYSELCNEINRSIQLGWRAVGVFVGAFALFALVEKEIITRDIATSLMILLATWATAHIFNTNYWYNRNLAIIANIEKQFLINSDLKHIQYYFGKHRESKSILQDVKIQLALNIGIVSLIILYHFITRVYPGILQPSLYTFDIAGVLPYIFLGLSVFYIITTQKKLVSKFEEFKKNSPGISIDTTDIEYGVGHPIDKEET
jgi:hypothetical protein